MEALDNTRHMPLRGNGHRHASATWVAGLDEEGPTMVTDAPIAKTSNENPLLTLEALGQSIWMDYICRGTIVSGELGRLIELDGVSGVTSNPSIFEKAIAKSQDYD